MCSRCSLPLSGSMECWHIWWRNGARRSGSASRWAARIPGIVKLVLREEFVLVGLGLILGIASSISLRSVVQKEIYGVAPLDPLVLGSVALLFAVIALLACLVPARRATQVDPAIVLSEQ